MEKSIYDKNAILCKIIQSSQDKDEVKQAKTELVHLNNGLIHSICYKLSRLYVENAFDEDDAYQEGCIGLLRASETYNPDKGAFSTYATIWINQSIQREFNKTGRSIRIPVHAKELYNEYRKKYPDLSEGDFLNTLMQNDEIGESDKEMILMASSVLSLTSLNVKISKEEGYTELGDMIMGDDGSKYERIEQFELHKDIESALDKLNEKERWVIINRFGLNGEKPKTFKECSESYPFGRTCRQNIQQTESRALAKLKRPYINKHLRDYVER